MINAISTRIKAITNDNGQPLFIEVKSALDVVDAMANPLNASPVAFIVPLEETPITSELEIGSPMQTMRSDVGLIIGVRTVGQRSDDANNLAVIRKKLRESLFGWSPLTGYKPFLLMQSNIQQLQTGQLFWMERFTTQYLEESIL